MTTETKTEITADIQAIQTAADRLFTAEAEIVQAYLAKKPSADADIRWITVEAWRTWVDADLFRESTRLGNLYPGVPFEVDRDQYVLDVRDLYLKMRAHDAFASLLEDRTGDDVTGLALLADAVEDEWASEGRKLDGLLAAIGATSTLVGDATMRFTGEIGLGVYYVLAQGDDAGVKAAARTALSDGAHRYVIGLRRLQRVMEEESGTFPPLEDTGRVNGPAWQSSAKAQSTINLIVERRMALRNDQFGKPLSKERLKALQQDEPTVTAAQAASLVGFII